MKTLTKQILSIALAVCICLTMLPAMIMKADAADSISMMVSYAQARVGKTGQELGYNDQWCAFFVSDCAVYAGQTKAIPYNGSAHNLYFAVLKAGGKVVSTPKKGDLVFYNCSACDTNNDGIAIMHVGLVENENYSIEGNLGPSGSTLYTRKVVRKGLNESYSHGSGHNTGNYVKRIYVRPAYDGGTGEHTCNKGTYVYYEAAHPHYKCYECSICGTVWRNTAEPTIVSSCTSCVPEKVSDSRYSAFLPIASYTRDTGNITVYDSSGTVYSNRYISGSTDLCLILEIYTDGWCKVKYPSSVESSGYFVAYVPFSVFASSTSPSSWTCTGNYTTYRRSDLSETMHTVNEGDSCLVVGTSGGLKQIIHPTPVNGQTCFMMGWVKEPKQIHASTDVVYLTLGETTSQVVYAWTSGYYDGNTSLYWSRNNTNISCSWGEWTDGKAPLTITANAVGTTTLTVGVKDSSAGTVLDSTTVTVTVNAKSYTVSYNANGGIGAPDSQTKYYNTTLTLSSTKPTRKGYTFVGWSTSSSASSASYQPGGNFTGNSNTTLYAVWQKGCETNSHSYYYGVTVAPTVSSTGTLSAACSICSGTTTVTLPKLNTTDYTYSVVKAATCEANGTGRYTWKTTTYGSYYFDVVISKTGHSYSYKVTQAPTTSATGTLTGTCSKCSGTTTVTLPKLNTADYTYTVTKEPSYTATGTARYTWKDTAYGEFYFEVTLDKLPVTLTKIEVTTNPTKTVYRIGESLNTTGLTLKATYSDGSTKTITSGFTTSGFSSTTAGTKTVTVTYGGKSTTFTATVQAATSETDAQIVVENKTAAAGETVAVTIAVKNNPGIASLKLKVAFDPMLTLTGVTYNTSIGGQFQQPQKMESPVTLNWFNGTADSEGDWVYVTLTFVVSDSAEGGSSAGISVTYNPDDVYDITETNIPFAIVNGSITIVDYIPGDINGDGVVNNKDVTRLFQYLSDWNVSVNEPAMDVNGDGSVNNKDLTRLFQYLSDWDVSIQ